MTSVVSGLGLGLFHSSLTQTGRTHGGPASIGQRSESTYVNIATGNLVLQGTDEQAQFRGNTINYTRTYNSQGIDTGFPDSWIFGFETQLLYVMGLGGPKGYQPSAVWRIGADGSEIRYNQSAAGVFVSTAGDGAHDTVTRSADGYTMIWREGSSLRTETHVDGRLVAMTDRNGAAWTLQRDAINGRITAITNDNGSEQIALQYNASGEVQRVETWRAGALAHGVEYLYDGLGRLSTVRTMLDPHVVKSSHQWFDTTYGYQGNTQVITSVTQSDGVTQQFTYDTQGRVHTVTSGSGSSSRTLTYTYDAATQSTTVDDGVALWEYRYDTLGQLTEVRSPAVDGRNMVTRYGYDPSGNGNLIWIQQDRMVGTQLVVDQTDFQYDAQGNLLAETNALGQRVDRTYDANNQLTSLTRHVDVSGSPVALTEHWVYDTQNRLQYTVDASGKVRRYAYDGNSQLARETAFIAAAPYTGAITLSALNGFSTDQQSSPQAIVDYTYDVRGLLAFEERYAITNRAQIDATTAVTLPGASTAVQLSLADPDAQFIAYTYDPQGLLTQRIVYRGVDRLLAETTSMVYDGMGRLTSTTDAAQRTTTTTYEDGNNRVVTLDQSSGVTRITARNSAGEIISVSAAASDVAGTRSSTHHYDGRGLLRYTQDVHGARQFFFYDAAGQLLHEVDSTGAVTEFSRDLLGRVVGTRQLAQRVPSMSGWVNGSTGQVIEALPLPSAHADDRLSVSKYDAAGQLIEVVDGENARTTFAYDTAGRLILTTRHSTDPVPETRRTRHFYDPAGRLLGTLDGENYLVENVYDGGGRLVKTISHATRVTSALIETGTLDQLRPPTDAGNDQVTRHYYDGRGQLLATVDAERYLTVHNRLETSHERTTIRYSTRVDAGVDLETVTLDALRLRPEITSSAKLTEVERYKATGELESSNRAGLLTTYAYDTAGRLTGTRAQDVDDLGATVTIDHLRRINGFGEVVAELSAEGAALLPSLTLPQDIENVWAQWSVKHSYDLLGRRIETVDQEGNKTWLFYDSEGRLDKTLRGNRNDQGVQNAVVEVQQQQYNAFGEVQSALTYTGKLVLPAPTYAAAQALAAMLPTFSPAVDTRVNYTYNRRGQLFTESDARFDDGSLSRTLRYNGFGELRQTELARAIHLATGLPSNLQTDTWSYDKRGLQTKVTSAVGVLDLVNRVELDAFGRVTGAYDARNNFVSFNYDKLGRQVTRTQLVSGRNEISSTTYDAFDRVLTETDANGRVTRYEYQDAGAAVDDLRVTMITPEDVRVTTHRNRRGMTVRIVDRDDNTTRYRYNLDGQLVKSIAADSGTVEQRYNTRGLITETVDPTGNLVRYTYDASGRTLTRVENAQAVVSEWLTTTYTYDGQGRQTLVVDPTSRRTVYEYDRAGNVLKRKRGDVSTPDAEVTRWTYDAQGTELTVTEGEGTSARVTAYQFDAAGRRTSEIVDPTGLQITTRYEYDADGNVVARHNARYATASNPTPDGVTRFVYDAAGRLVYMVEPNDAVTAYRYDASGRRTGMRTYASVPTLPSASMLTVTEVTDAIGTSASDALDRIGYEVYDRDGRLRFAFAADGSWTQYRYDARGLPSETLVAATAWSLTTTERDAVLLGDPIGSVDLDDYFASRFTDSSARRSFQRYDSVGRATYTVTDSGTGGVVSLRAYDLAGRVTSETRYAVTIAYDNTQTSAQIATAITTANGNTVENHRRSLFLYDGVGRLAYTLDETSVVAGVQYYTVAKTSYDAASRVDGETRYRTEVAVPTLTLAGVQTAVTGVTGDTTGYGYDAAGRRTTVTDPLGRSERYEYDASGLLSKYIDRENSAWTYQYDKAGRRTLETSPTVSVVYIDASAGRTELVRAIHTKAEYDALGNVVARTEDFDQQGLGGTTFRTRTTRYDYDHRGHQIRTRFPRAGELDANGVVLNTAAGPEPTVEVTFDALGRAVVQKDARGFRSYIVYDALGRLRFEVDQERYVTEYRYNAYGDQTAVIRHAVKADTTRLGELGWSAGQPLTMALLQDAIVLPAHIDDRVVDIEYDKRGNKVRAREAAVDYRDSNGVLRTSTRPETTFEYDALGRLVKESVLLEQLPAARWAETWHWYDESGRKIVTVDAERYVTTWSYDARGLVTAQKEYARAIAENVTLTTATPPAVPAAGDATIGFDRATSWSYDAARRKTVETVQGVIAKFEYDKEGRLLKQTDAFDTADVAVSERRYDAMGRLRQVREPQHRVLKDTTDLTNLGVGLGSESAFTYVTTVTGFEYDAYGNAVDSLRAGFTINPDDSLTLYGTPGQQVVRLSFYRYDVQGRLIWEQDGASQIKKITWRKYDEADHVVEQHYLVQTDGIDAKTEKVSNWYVYDDVGHQRSVDTIRTNVANGLTYRDSYHEVDYNAFGEVTGKRVRGGPGAAIVDQRSYVYDRAGRLSSTDDNAAGVSFAYGYDLAGRKNYETHPLATGSAVFRDELDRLGRATISRLPINGTDASAVPTLRRSYDRWGNVLTFRDAEYDPNNAAHADRLTEYTYDHRNQVLTEKRAKVVNLREDNIAVDVRPLTSYVYDPMGRVRSVTDANGNVRETGYDASGAVQWTEDGENYRTLYAYNAVGEQTHTQDAAGHITFQQYDERGRVEVQGDWMPDAGGNTRTRYELQQFELNQDGHRLAVTNGENETQRYAYNSRGEVTRSKSALSVQGLGGVEMAYQYDELGRKILEHTLGIAAQTWHYDTKGRLDGHVDLGAHSYAYTYGAQGVLERLTISAGNTGTGTGTRDTTYYASGLVRSIVEGGTTTTYEYDKNGNLIKESNVATDIGANATHSTATLNTTTELSYDANGRLQRVLRFEEGTPRRCVLDLSYAYDAVGNRRRVTARSGYGPGVIAPTGGNNAPVYNAPTVPPGYVNVAFSFAVASAFQDVDSGQTLTFSAPANQLPPGVSLSASGLLTGTPTTAGTYNIQVTATDNGSPPAQTTGTLTITIAPANVAPTADPIPTQNAIRGVNWSFDFGPFFHDDGVLTYAVSGLPPGVSYPGSFTAIEGTPTTAGTYAVTILATDNGVPQLSVSRTFDIVVGTVSNLPPRRGSLWQSSFQRTFQDRDGWQTVNLPHVFEDPEGGALTFELTSTTPWRFRNVTSDGSGGVTFDVDTSSFGEFSATFRARDAQGNVNVAIDDFTLDVTVGNLRLEEILGGPKDGEIGDPGDGGAFGTTDKLVVPEFPQQANVEQYWFTYDANNRTRIANGHLKQNVQTGSYSILLEAPVGVANNAFMNIYDAGGNVQFVVTQRLPTQQYARMMSYDLRGQLLTTTTTQIVTNGQWGSIDAGNVVERREYDHAGRLLREIGVFHRGKTVSWIVAGGETNTYDISGYVESVREYQYDDDGRIDQQASYRRETEVTIPGPNPQQDAAEWVKQSYARWIIPGGDAAEEALQMNPATVTVAADRTSLTEYHDRGNGPDGNGYDAAGRLKGFLSYAGGNHGTEKPTVFRNQQYFGWDNWQERLVVGTQLQSNGNTAETKTTSDYDAFGHRTKIDDTNRTLRPNGTVDNTTNLQVRYFAYTGSGQILRRRDGKMVDNVFKQGTDYFASGAPNPVNPMPRLLNRNNYWNLLGTGDKKTVATEWSAKGDNHQFVYASGQQVGELSNKGEMDLISRVTGFTSSENGSTQVQVQTGENLRAIAQRLYGAGELWYVLAAANGLSSPDEELTAGLTLTAPQVTTRFNNATTFRPYNASEATGPTLPSVPYIPAPPKASCNPLQIVVIIVAIVATIYTAGAAAGTFANAAVATATGSTASSLAVGSAVLSGTATVASTGLAIGAGTSFAAAAVGGFVGSVASQLVGKALGVTDHFSLRQAVGSGLTAGFTAGIGATGLGSTLRGVAESRPWLAAAANGVLGTVGGYAANRLAGIDAHFSWRSVAANAIASGITAKVAPAVIGDHDWSEFTQDLVAGAIGGVVSMHARRVLGAGGRVDYGQVAVDAFGNALGNALARKLDSRNLPKGVVSFGQVERELTPEDDGIYRTQDDDTGKMCMVETPDACAPTFSPVPRRPLIDPPKRLGELPTYTEYLMDVDREHRKLLGPDWNIEEFNPNWSKWRQDEWNKLANVVHDAYKASHPDHTDRSGKFRANDAPASKTELEIMSAAAAEMRQDYEKHYQQYDDGSVLGGVIYRAGTIFSSVGISAIEGVASLGAIATDEASRQQAWNGVKYAVTHPGEMHAAAVAAGVRFLEASSDEQWKIVGTTGLSTLVSLGSGMIAAKTGELALSASINVARATGQVARRLEPVAARLVRGGANSRLASTSGRNTVPLTQIEIDEATKFARDLGFDRDIDYRPLDRGYNTSYSDWDWLVISDDLLPNALGKSANSRMSSRAVLSHEIVGHRQANLAGRAFEPGSLHDEVQASARAARNSPLLNDVERYQLRRDAIERIKNYNQANGTTLRWRDLREQLWLAPFGG